VVSAVFSALTNAEDKDSAATFSTDSIIAAVFFSTTLRNFAALDVEEKDAIEGKAEGNAEGNRRRLWQLGGDPEEFEEDNEELSQRVQALPISVASIRMFSSAAAPNPVSCVAWRLPNASLRHGEHLNWATTSLL